MKKSYVSCLLLISLLPTIVFSSADTKITSERVNNNNQQQELLLKIISLLQIQLDLLQKHSTSKSIPEVAFYVSPTGNNSNSGTAVTNPFKTFAIGSRVQIALGPLNTRSSPNVTGTLLGTQATGVLGTVMAGPIVQGRYNWWQVNYDTGVDGWSVDTHLIKVVVVTATPTSVNSSLAQKIAADMSSIGEGKAHSITTWAQSAGAWTGLISGLRQENVLPSGWTSGTAWGQIYRDSTNASDSNTRVAIKNFNAYLLHPTTKTWVKVQGPTFIGAAYLENYATNDSLSANTRFESDGSLSVKLTKRYNYHFYSEVRWNLATQLGTTATPAGFCATFQARKIIDNSNLPDDRTTARYLMNVGGDWWQSPSVEYGGFNVNNSEIGFSKFKYVTNDWQSIIVCTPPDSVIATNPPPMSDFVGTTPTQPQTQPLP